MKGVQRYVVLTTFDSEVSIIKVSTFLAASERMSINVLSKLCTLRTCTIIPS